MNKLANSTNGAPAVIADKLALVYDKTGEILHVHRVTTLEGGRSRSDEEIGRAALDHAKRSRHKRASAEAEVLVIEAHELKPGHTHRVDVAKRVLRGEPRK
jgi:hypothetical protein